MKVFKSQSSGGLDSNAVNSIAAGNTLSLEQQLLAAQGQVGKTVLAVGYTFNQGSEGPSPGNKAQITSLEDGNVVFVYATGSDFNAGVIQEGPVFLAKGEVYVIENVQNGSIITATEGAYGFSQQRNNNDESPMPLLSLALAFTDTFLFAFRSSQAYDPEGDTDNQGWIHVVNGPIASMVTLLTGSGVVVQGQQDISLEPWEYLRLYTNANSEYRLTATNSIMACINARMRNSLPRFYDARLILPLTNDGITWPRSGFVSALYSNTQVNWYVNDNEEGSFSVSPGSPVDFDAAPPVGTGAADTDYEPRGATRVQAAGLISAYSGADTAGLEATPLCPVSTFTQRIALPLHMRINGDGADNGIALASIYEGKARLFQWNQSTGEADLVTVNDENGSPTTEILLKRRVGDVEQGDAPDREAQLHPAAALISPQGAGGSDPNAYDFISDFTGGYIEVDVPCTCVFNSQQNENGLTTRTFRGTSGTSVVGIHADDDEQLSYGITPETIRAEVRQGSDNRLYKRVIAANGIDTWEVA